MGRITIIILVALMMVGCGQKRVQTKFQDVSKPILVCPTPQELNGGNPVPYRPHLEIYNLNAESTPGEVAKAYQITIKELQGYSEVLYKLLSSYDRQSEEYKKLKAIMETLYPEGTEIPAEFGL